MHKLGREVWFSINPFLPEDGVSSDLSASKTSGEGLLIFLELCVGLAGEVEPATGFVVNVVNIDRCVYEHVVPIFSERIRENFRQHKQVCFSEIGELLKLTQEKLADKFGKAILSELVLKLNPFRKVAVDCEDNKMIYFSEKFEFAATHKLWNDDFSQERNFEIFGKCANPTGHGHNYIIEVTLKMPIGKDDFRMGDFERTVDNKLIQQLDHKNLNADVSEFGKTNPTVENIAVFAWDKLVDKFSQAKLHCITVWETDKTYSTYYG